MDEILTATAVPVVTTDQAITTPVNPNPSGLSFRDGDFAADIAKLQAETGMKVETTPESIQISQPTMPAQPEKAAVTETEKAKVEVPEKFKAPDGSVDTEKLNKSLVNVEETLAQYLEKEKELKRKMNEVNAQKNAYLTPPQTPAPTLPTNTITPEFAKRLEEDIAKEGPGVVLAKLFTAAQESVEERVRKEIETIKSHNAANTTKAQIEAIGKADPWVYTPDGLATLTKILDEQPYLWQAQDPYKAAYLQYSGIKAVSVSKSAPQVVTTTPTARPSAPVPTGQAMTQAPNPVKDFGSMTPETLNAYLKTLTPVQEKEFWKKQGFPGY